ncbi:MAG: hypothetical protein U0269_27405 [Polyangiales bacterium]
MASKPKVPFALHQSVTALANFDVPFGLDVALSPDGALVAVNSGEWGDRRLLLIDVASGAVRDGLPQGHRRYELLPSWSPDGQRWVISAGEGDPGKAAGVLTVGERDSGTLKTLHTPKFQYCSRNSQARPSPIVEWAEDSATLVQRTTTRDERNGLFTVDVATGSVRERWLAKGHCDVMAHTISTHGSTRRLYALCGDPGELSGLLWFDGESEKPSGRLPWVFGLRLIATKHGVWALGHPGYCFWVAETKATKVLSARESRKARLEALAGRAKAAWDVDYLNNYAPRDLDPAGTYNIAYGRNGAAAANQTPTLTDGARCFENDLFWETAFAAPFGEDGEDGVVVSDGVGVWKWRATDEGLEQVLLADDLQKSTHRGCRIVGLSAAKDTVAVLWKKDARGAKSVVSLLKVR